MTQPLPTTINGAIEAAPTTEPRVVFGEISTLTVEPTGDRTLARRDTGIKWPSDRRVVLLVGELDGVRCYVNEEAGIAQVTLTRREIRP